MSYAEKLIPTYYELRGNTINTIVSLGKDMATSSYKVTHSPTILNKRKENSNNYGSLITHVDISKRFFIRNIGDNMEETIYFTNAELYDLLQIIEI